MNTAAHWEPDSVFKWLDDEPILRVGILTGTGRAFCAGADLKEWNTSNSTNSTRPMPPSGFGALSQRKGKKPIIAAVNGLAYGGGFEMIINTDLVLCSPNATFALPEVKRGVVAIAGALPRLVRTIGKQRATEMALTGRVVSAKEALGWGFVNEVAGEEGNGVVVERAVEVAGLIAANSPDAVVCSREGIMLGWEGVGVEEGTKRLREGIYGRVVEGENFKEGVRAFVEKREARWVDSKL
ncbi:MAG: hypothetical protein M1812_003028 [Candelaria pacifica]|nr:MAG: hypothetical protein M1812_003028 [Candelaria pacifica]